MNRKAKIKTVNDPAAVVRRAATFLLPPYPEGSVARGEAEMAAWELVQEAIEHCVRAGRDDLAFKLQSVGFELRGLPEAHLGDVAPQPTAHSKRRRKCKPAGSHGARERAALRKAGGISLGAI